MDRKSWSSQAEGKTTENTRRKETHKKSTTSFDNSGSVKPSNLNTFATAESSNQRLYSVATNAFSAIAADISSVTVVPDRYTGTENNDDEENIDFQGSGFAQSTMDESINPAGVLSEHAASSTVSSSQNDKLLKTMKSLFANPTGQASKKSETNVIVKDAQMKEKRQENIEQQGEQYSEKFHEKGATGGSIREENVQRKGKGTRLEIDFKSPKKVGNTNGFLSPSAWNRVPQAVYEKKVPGSDRSTLSESKSFVSNQRESLTNHKTTVGSAENKPGSNRKYSAKVPTVENDTNDSTNMTARGFENLKGKNDYVAEKVQIQSGIQKPLPMKGHRNTAEGGKTDTRGPSSEISDDFESPRLRSYDSATSRDAGHPESLEVDDAEQTEDRDVHTAVEAQLLTVTSNDNDVIVAREILESNVVSTSSRKENGQLKNHVNDSIPQKKKMKDEDDFEEMMDKHRQFFSIKLLYRSEGSFAHFESVLSQVLELEIEDNRMRHQFLLRLARTKFLEMQGPVVAVVREIIRESNDAQHGLDPNRIRSERLLTMIIALIDEYLIRLPHSGNTYTNATTLIGMIDVIPWITECYLNEQLKHLKSQLNHLMSYKMHDPSKKWSANLSFASEAIIPEFEVLLTRKLSKEIFNIIKGPFDCASHYMEVWYRLMQEDYFYQLKSAILDFKRSITTVRKNAGSVRLNDGFHYVFTRILVNAHIDGQVKLLLEFCLNGLQNVNWDITDRLRSESLIVLSNDNFKTGFYGIIQDCDENKKSNGQIWIQMLDGCNITSAANLHGIESKDLFEPYRCVLDRLKDWTEVVNQGQYLPMEKYFVHCDTRVAHPEYMADNTLIRIGAEMICAQQLDVLPSLNLDDSQSAALKLALTNEVALIQGPPGTGKSFVGAKLMDILLQNEHIWQDRGHGCIMLLAYTNHAIDQFVLECEKMGMDMGKTVRLGARGGELMEKFSLKNRLNELYEYREYKNLLWRSRRQKSDLQGIEKSVGEISNLVRAERNKFKFEWYKHRIPEQFVERFELNYAVTFSHESLLVWLWGDNEVGTNNPTFDVSSDVDMNKLKLQNYDPMTKDEAISATGKIKDMSIKDRRRLFVYWCEAARKECNRLLDDCEIYTSQVKYWDRYFRRQKDIAVLRRANVIAATTSGACKHAHLIEAVKPTIVLVEEAAEVLESHIVAPLTEGCKHLILIGDHQQLRPKIAVYYLEKRNLHISLFERLIMNDFPSVRLQVQHRMHPEIASLLVPHIYPELENHESVEHYPLVKGIRKRMVFLYHNNEEKATSETESKTNEFEAEYLVSLYKYLIQQGYKPGDITILTLYKGQMRLIQSKLQIANPKIIDEKTQDQKEARNGKPKFVVEKRQDPNQVAVKTVDNYQGEENTIILLSFVRSNRECNIGFLKWANRICVALSRAKHGFYAVGDFWLFARSTKSDLWQKLCEQLLERNDPNLCSTLEIVCQNHGTVVDVVDAESFSILAPDGGCTKLCDYRLSCGHQCTRSCHIYDPDHINFECQKKCDGELDCGHKCPKTCSQLGDDRIFGVAEKFSGEYRKCDRCTKNNSCTKEMDVLPSCGHAGKTTCSEKETYVCLKNVTILLIHCNHTKTVVCSTDKDSIKCRTMVTETLDCGHQITKECFVKARCKTEVPVKLPCNHEGLVACYQQLNVPAVNSVVCHVPVTVTLDCGHDITRDCCAQNGRCMSKVPVDLRCGHKGMLECHRHLDALSVVSVICNENVKATLDCGHYIYKKCFEKNSQCMLELPVNLPCGHNRKMECWRYRAEKENGFASIVCHEKVDVKLDCGHSVQKECHQSNILCSFEVRVKIFACGHEKTVQCHQANSNNICCTNMVEVVSQCGHTQTVECHKSQNATCPRTIEIELPCQHKQTVRCELADTAECNENVEIKLKCGHTAKILCKDRDRAESLVKCKEIVEKQFHCGHKNRVKCYVPIEKCPRMISQQRECGHFLYCPCWTIESSLAKECKNPVDRQMICGHMTSVPCHAGRSNSMIIDTCGKRCTFSCSHNIRCRNSCSEKCFTCRRPCNNSCPHSRCSRFCYEECDRIPCNEPCLKKLECKHQCGGLCGEPCPIQCQTCRPRNNPKGKVIRIFPCNHQHEVNYLDAHMRTEKSEDYETVIPKYCPMRRCRSLINDCPRYSNQIKRYMRVIKRDDYTDNMKWLYCNKGKHLFTVSLHANLHDRNDHVCAPDAIEEVSMNYEDEDDFEEAQGNDEVVLPQSLLNSELFRNISSSWLNKMDQRERQRPNKRETEDYGGRRGGRGRGAQAHRGANRRAEAPLGAQRRH